MTDFFENYRSGKSQIVRLDLPADLETPLSAYLKLTGNAPYSFLLESVEGGEVLGRYSGIGWLPDLIYKCKGNSADIETPSKEKVKSGEALSLLKDLIKDCHIDICPETLPPMAASGLFGMLGYDMIRLIEDLPDSNPECLGLDDAVMIRPQMIAVFDNVKQILTLATAVYPDDNISAEDAHDLAWERLHKAQKDLQVATNQLAVTDASKLDVPLDISSNMTKAEYEAAVEKAIEYILAGDIFQVVPSQRFRLDFDLPAFALYRSLRRLNPSPFLVLFNFEDYALIASSPEIMVRVRDNEVTIRPIAGTRPRGKNSEEDKQLAEDLLNDEKECAEHLMLLDLGRNDVGKVSKPGSVKVTDRFFIEKYSHVMHIVSNVTGELREDLSALDALFSGLPAGTVSGAPKIRAMEIIDELETERRGFYAGCIGYIDGQGNLDTCIALRTALLKDNQLVLQAGAGVVADSIPEKEYEETINKAKAFMAAAEDAVKSSQLYRSGDNT